MTNNLDVEYEREDWKRAGVDLDELMDIILEFVRQNAPIRSFGIRDKLVGPVFWTPLLCLDKLGLIKYDTGGWIAIR